MKDTKSKRKISTDIAREKKTKYLNLFCKTAESCVKKLKIKLIILAVG